MIENYKLQKLFPQLSFLMMERSNQSIHQTALKKINRGLKQSGMIPVMYSWVN